MIKQKPTAQTAQPLPGIVFRKRRAVRKSEEKARQRNRLAEISRKISLYDPEFNRQKLDRALSIAGNKIKRQSGENLNNRLSEPLDVLETLVEHYKPDPDVVNAAVLYPTVLPDQNGFVDIRKLKEYEQDFGRRTRLIIEDIIAMWSRPVTSSNTQEGEEESDETKNIKRDLTLQSLLIARSEAAVAVRCAETLNNLRDIEKVSNPDAHKAVMERGDLLAKLAYLARCPELRDAILNEKFRIADPQKFGKTRAFIGTTVTKDQIDHNPWQQDRYPLTDEDIQNANRRLQGALEDILGAGNYKLVGIRRKQPHATDTKTEHKGQHVSQLGDLNGARCVVRTGYIDKLIGGDAKKLDHVVKNSAKVSGQDEGKKSHQQIVCESAYWDIASQIGRHSEDPATKRFFALLSQRDPDGKGGDSRFDNYYADPKKSGYLSLQDSVVIFVESTVMVDGKPRKITKAVEAELQIVDEAADENNYRGGPDHTLYKTDMLERREPIEDWRACSALTLDHNKERTPKRFEVVSYQPEKETKPLLVEASNTTSRACVYRDFVDQHIDVLRHHHPGLKSSSDVTGVCVKTTNPLINRDPETPLSLDAPMRSDDCIVGFTFNSRSAAYRAA